MGRHLLEVGVAVTYRPELLPPAAERYVEGNLATSSASVVDLTYTSTHADTALAATPSPDAVWTILKTGQYVISARFDGSVAFGGNQLHVSIVVNGVSVASDSLSSPTTDNVTLHVAAKWRGQITAGQVVRIQGRMQGGGSAGGTVLMEFVPIAANPQ